MDSSPRGFAVARLIPLHQNFSGKSLFPPEAGFMLLFGELLRKRPKVFGAERKQGAFVRESSVLFCLCQLFHLPR